MFSRKRFLAGASAVALAASATLGGAGIAGAQGSSEIAADLGLAAAALNGPVTVTGNEEGGPTVTYSNRNDFEQRCVGFTMPYSTIVEEGIDPSAIGGDILAALPVITAIEAAGDVSILSSNGEGAPISYDSVPGGGLLDPDATGVIQAVLGLLEPTVEAGVKVAAGEAITWTATGPETPAAAVALCVPDADEALLDINFGIDKQVVVDQLNGTLPGGSIGTGSVSGGSVATGASLLGSLGGGAGAGTDTEVEPPAEAASGSASSASGTGELPSLEALV